MRHQSAADTTALALSPNRDQRQIPCPVSRLDRPVHHGSNDLSVLDIDQPALSLSTPAGMMLREQRSQHLAITGLK